MTETRVVHVRRAPHFDIYIGRPMGGQPGQGWGNPFKIGRDGTREEVIEQYRAWILNQPALLARLPELRGKVLGCWCKPSAGFNGRLLCHGQVLAGLADGVPPESIE